MNRKGFTLVELIATLVVLSIIAGITVVSITGFFGDAKKKSEDLFIGTLKDAMDMYLSSDAKDLDFSLSCINELDKTYGSVTVYKKVITFQDVINSKYKPITQKELVNPANEDLVCANAQDIVVNIYRDEDYVYYYNIHKSAFGCLSDDGLSISNLPEGYVCG